MGMSEAAPILHTRLRGKKCLVLRLQFIFTTLITSQIDPRKRNTVDVGHPIQDDSTTDDGSGMTDDNSVALPKRKQARKGFPDLDVLDQELLGDGASSQEDRRSEEDGTFQRRAAKPLESSRFQSTPPAWLTKRDRIEWETRQQRKSCPEINIIRMLLTMASQNTVGCQG